MGSEESKAYRPKITSSDNSGQSKPNVWPLRSDGCLVALPVPENHNLPAVAERPNPNL